MKKRLLYETIRNHLKEKQITLIQGARQTGKTTLMKQVQEELNRSGKRTSFLSLENKRILAELNDYPPNIFQLIPPLVSGNRQYIFIDEIQYLNDPSNFLKHLYDEYHEKIKLVVSGSSGFYIDKKFRDSLAGRKKIVNLPTMGFKEFLFFRGDEELSGYSHTEKIPKLYLTDLKNLFAEYLLYGGYPDIVLEPSLERKLEILKEIAGSYIKKDIEEAYVQYPDAYLNILAILSQQIGSLLNVNSISKSLKIKSDTIQSYLYVMQKSFHIGLVKPFYKSVSSELRKMRKSYFMDMGLRNYFAGNFDPVITRDDKGEILENYVYRLFSDHYDEDWDIHYWRTQKQQEIDFIIQEKHAYEVKFSANLFKPYKYKLFQQKYPNIPLELLTYENILEFNPGGEG